MNRHFNLFLIGLFLQITILSQPGFTAEKPDALFGKSRNYDDVLVEKVVSADYFILKSGEKLRLIGLVAPEPPKKKKVVRNEHGFIIEEKDPTTSFEEQALEFTKALVEGKHVRLEFDIEKKDEDFRTFSYVFLKDNTFINAEILRQGFANLKILTPNIKYQKELKEAYQEARREKRGIQSE